MDSDTQKAEYPACQPARPGEADLYPSAIESLIHTRQLFLFFQIAVDKFPVFFRQLCSCSDRFNQDAACQYIAFIAGMSTISFKAVYGVPKKMTPEGVMKEFIQSAF